ncbi:MAG: transcriptional regulator, partial [Puniceicoccales bacterium]|nr:transcriptional regulator [Puniceicoccales bacterium]
YLLLFLFFVTMKNDPSAFQALERIFHEKSRLAIVACAAELPEGISFIELRETCGMTDGNLKAHLNALEGASIIATHKELHEGRARTIVTLTAEGREQFIAYLLTLEDALRAAAKSAGVAQERGRILSPKLREA